MGDWTGSRHFTPVHKKVGTTPTRILEVNPTRRAAMVRHITSTGARIWGGKQAVAVGIGGDGDPLEYSERHIWEHQEEVYYVAESGEVTVSIVEEFD